MCYDIVSELNRLEDPLLQSVCIKAGHVIVNSMTIRQILRLKIIVAYSLIKLFKQNADIF
jgi:hypothetical protein